VISTLQNRYRILRRIGVGGIGEVFLAEHLTLKRREAIKILKPQVATDPAFVQRFRREARASNRLAHPNIVTVYDFGQLPDGRFFLSMEYVEGRPIDDILREGPLVPARALAILVQLADAADHAHGRGVVHRDLKPGNLILAGDLLKVFDFGIAKIISPEPGDSIVITQEGEVLGTPAYMAPEQWTGTTIDLRTDLYAIGCIAYEMLVGQPPFTGTPMGIMTGHLNRTVTAPSEMRRDAGIPAELDEVILKLLAKKADDRYPNARALLDALARVPGASPPEKARTVRRTVAMQSEFADVDTGVDSTPLSVSQAVTQRLTADDAREELRAQLVQIADSMIGLGARELALASALGRVREMIDRRLSVETEMVLLEARVNDAEHARRERQASIRLAAKDLAAQLADEAEEIQGELERLRDSQIALSASLELCDNALRPAFDELEKQVLAAAPAFEADPYVAPLLQKLRTLQDALRMLVVSAGRSK
jgi:hypothetical protein